MGRRLNKKTSSKQHKSRLLQWGIAAGIVVASIFWQQQRSDPRDELIRTNLSSSDSKVAIRDSPLGGTGLFSTQPIPKNNVIVQIPLKYKITPALVEKEYPNLRGIVNDALSLHHAATNDSSSSPSCGQILTVIAALFELSKKEASVFHSYFQILPRDNNGSKNMAFYWTEEELQCVGHPKEATNLQTNLKTFKAVFDTVVQQFEPLQSLPDINTTATAEWLYVMVKTRGFGDDGALIPIIDSMNHDPLKSVSPFVPQSSLPPRGVMENTHYMIATHDIPANTEVFNSYSDYLSPTSMAAHYGFVSSMTNAAFVDSYSISQDMMQVGRMLNNATFTELCNSHPALFFGNISSVVEANWMGASKSTHFVPFQPTISTYECLYMMLQTRDQKIVADYMTRKLEKEIAKYEEMAKHCQSSDQGNFPLIHESNVVTADLLRGVLQEARRVLMSGEVEY